jgi:hypothetical protein
MARRAAPSTVVRRSVALPRWLVAEVQELAPAELRNNLNRLVIVALKDFAERRRVRAFEEAMDRMGADPAIRSECRRIAREFAEAEADGLAADD